MKIFDGPPRPAETAISSAVNRLLAAGMVLRHRSTAGNSYYLGWPWRKGVLRVSDHAGRSPNEERNPIYAKLTIHENSMPKNETNLDRMLARALGSFLIKSPIDEAHTEITNPKPVAGNPSRLLRYTPIADTGYWCQLLEVQSRCFPALTPDQQAEARLRDILS